MADVTTENWFLFSPTLVLSQLTAAFPPFTPNLWAWLGGRVGGHHQRAGEYCNLTSVFCEKGDRTQPPLLQQTRKHAAVKLLTTMHSSIIGDHTQSPHPPGLLQKDTETHGTGKQLVARQRRLFLLRRQHGQPSHAGGIHCHP